MLKPMNRCVHFDFHTMPGIDNFGANFDAEKFADEAKTPLIFIKGKEPIGIIAVADVIREDSAQAVRTLSDMGIKTVMQKVTHNGFVL